MRDMPEILFRGKRVDNGEWIYGYPLIDTADCQLKAEGKCVCPHDGSYAEIYHWLEGFHEYEGDEVIPETIGQYTGLTDKNGVKIFMGDILKTRVYVHCKAAVVMYSEGCFWVHNPNGGNMPLFKYVDMESGKADDVKVIGNIHDNPELLEGGGEA